MNVDIERGVIYHLDTHCSMDATDLRKIIMKNCKDHVLYCIECFGQVFLMYYCSY